MFDAGTSLMRQRWVSVGLDFVAGDRVVVVTVAERHASAVMGILAMQAPAMMTEAPLNAA